MTHPLSYISNHHPIKILVTCLLFLMACRTTTPEKFFGIAVLNTNLISDFGTPALAKHINAERSVPSDTKNGNAETRVKTSIQVIENSLKNIRELNETAETIEIKKLSARLFEYVLPVYKKEYLDYARLCDQHAPQQQKDVIIQSINEKYNTEFEKLYTLLISKGKAYAAANGINVH